MADNPDSQESSNFCRDLIGLIGVMSTVFLLIILLVI